MPKISKVSLVPAPAQTIIEPEPDVEPEAPVPVPVPVLKLRQRKALTVVEDEPAVGVTTPEPKDDLVTLLEQKGYRVLSKVVDKSTVVGLKAGTVYGEWVVISIDKKGGWQNMRVEAGDVVWVAGEPLLALPEAAKTGYNATVDPSALGVAIEQGAYLTLLKRDTLESVPTESNYYMEGGVGKSITAYPVMRLSDILQDPDLATKSIHRNTAALQTYSRRLADSGVAVAIKKMKALTSMLEDYQKKEASAVKRLDETYRQLIDWYDKYQEMEQTPDTQSKQSKVSSNIRVRQDAMRRLLRASQAWSSDKTQTFLQELDTKLEDDLRYLQGVGQGVDYIMTE